jgi:hypothetical protein
MKKTNLKIQHATSYSMFSILPMNRDINSAHVQKMIESIKMMGIIRPVIICETDTIEGVKKKYILDGQHLATACEREGLAIPYTTIKVNDEKDIVCKMAMLNNSSKSWDLMNYVNAYKMYYPDYMKLFKWKNMYDMEPSMIGCIALERNATAGVSTTIRSGKFTIINPKTEEMCKAFNDIFLRIGKTDRWIRFKFLAAFMENYNSYNHEKTLKNVDKHIKTIKLLTDADETLNYIKKNIFNI